MQRCQFSNCAKAGEKKIQQTHNTEEITTTASKMGERMIHQKFMFMFCSQHLKETNETEEEMSLVPPPPAKNLQKSFHDRPTPDSQRRESGERVAAAKTSL